MQASPTIRTLARLAGVSTATVSLALRNHPRIRLNVRKRIQQIALEAGYKADPLVATLLAQLRSKRKQSYQSTLALITLGESYSDLKRFETVREWVAGCEERAALLGYKIDHFSLLDSDAGPERLVKILRSRNIRGLLVICSDIGYTIKADRDPLWKDSSSVVIGVQPVYPVLSFTSNEQFSTTVMAVHEIRKLGYKRPGLCIWSDIDERVKNRFSGGFYVGQDEITKSNRIPKFDFDYHKEEAFKVWLKRYHPDVVLTVHVEIADWIRSTGFKIPEDIGLVHLDNHSAAQWAGVQQNNKDVGREAVNMLIGQLHRNEFGVPHYQRGLYVTGRWVAGPSLRKQN